MRHCSKNVCQTTSVCSNTNKNGAVHHAARNLQQGPCRTRSQQVLLDRRKKQVGTMRGTVVETNPAPAYKRSHRQIRRVAPFHEFRLASLVHSRKHRETLSLKPGQICARMHGRNTPFGGKSRKSCQDSRKWQAPPLSALGSSKLRRSGHIKHRSQHGHACGSRAAAAHPNSCVRHHACPTKSAFSWFGTKARWPRLS